MADMVCWARIVVAGPDGTHRAILLTGAGPPDLAAVGRLARIALAAHRAGGRMWLEDVSPELADLLDLAGLRGQMGRQPEAGEDPPGVQE